MVDLTHEHNFGWSLREITTEMNDKFKFSLLVESLPYDDQAMPDLYVVELWHHVNSKQWSVELQQFVLEKYGDFSSLVI